MNVSVDADSDVDAFSLFFFFRFVHPNTYPVFLLRRFLDIHYNTRK